MLNSNLFPLEIFENTGYGYELDNPIRATSIPETYKILENLVPIVEEYKYGCVQVKYNRLGAFNSNKIKSIVDKYEVLYRIPSKESLSGFAFKLFFIYICAYKDNNESYTPMEIICNADYPPAPKGFKYINSNNMKL